LKIVKQIKANYGFLVIVLAILGLGLIFSTQFQLQKAQSQTTPTPAAAAPQVKGIDSTTAEDGSSLAQVNTFIHVGNTLESLVWLTSGRRVSAQATLSDGTTRNYYYYSGGAVNQLVGGMGMLYANKPASFEVWANDLTSRITPVKDVYAQTTSPTYNPGQGYNLLSPVLPLWKATSNLVYMFYVVIVIAIAFLIVFRSQLNGQDTINLFNAIPSLIISFILVIFSYPLSAVFVDFITIGSGLTYGILVGKEPADPSTCTTQPGYAPGCFLYSGFRIDKSLVNDISGISNDLVKPTTDLQIDDSYMSVWFIWATAGVNPTTKGVDALIPQNFPLSSTVTNVVQGIAGSSAGSTLLTLVFAIATFTASFNLFFKLAREYIILTMYPVLAPFFFLFAAIPGSTNSIVGMYFRRLAAASLTFIAIYALFLVVIIISRQPNNVGELSWVPPLLGYSQTQFQNSAVLANIAKPLIGYFLFISAPVVPDLIQQYVSPPTELPFLQNAKERTQKAGASLMQIGNVINNAIKQSTDTQPRTR
jgi:hypothetical protein